MTTIGNAGNPVVNVRHPNLVINASHCGACGTLMHGGKCSMCSLTGGVVGNVDDPEDNGGGAGCDAECLDASREAFMASHKMGDESSAGHAATAFTAASQGDSVSAEKSHLSAMRRSKLMASRAMDPAHPVGGEGRMNKGLAGGFKNAARLHAEAAALHAAKATVGQDDDDDATTDNQKVKLRGAVRSYQREVRNARPAAVTVNGRVGVGDVLDTAKSDYRQVVAEQRRRESHSRNARDGGNSPYPQSDLPQSPLQRGMDLIGRPSSPHSFDNGQGDDLPTDPNHGRSGGPRSGGDLGSTYDRDTPPSVRGVPGIQLLDAHQQQAVDTERARRLGLDYDPNDAFQLTTPRTMAELLARERMEGHTRNQAAANGDPNVLILPTFNAKEALAEQMMRERGRRR